MKSGILETLCSALLAGTFVMSCASPQKHPANFSKTPLTPAQVESVAECLQEKGVVMYGAEWCVNCEQQKEYFGESFSKITYVECYEDADWLGRGSKSEGCKKIRAFPAWEFSDEKIVYGLRMPEKLAKIAGCVY